MFWNVNALPNIGHARLDRVVKCIAGEPADVRVLAEVPVKRADAFQDALRGALSKGIHLHYSVQKPVTRKHYGLLFVSRWPMTTLPDLAAPFPHLCPHVRVDAPGAFEVVGVHAPNGSANGWRKIDTIEPVLELAQAGTARPLLVCGDLNEPECWPVGEAPDSFAFRRSRTGTRKTEGSMRRPDKNARTKAHRENDTFPRSRWQDAVAGLLHRGPLRHAWRALHPDRPLPATLIKRNGEERSFDHVLADPRVRMERIGFHHAWREDGTSDHSAVWLDFEL